MLKVLDLFCGMGGLSLGFALAGLGPVEGHDIWPRAVATYNLNLRRLGCRAEVTDLTRRAPKGDFDVVVGGPPCQPFSRANAGPRGEGHPLWPTFPAYFDVVLEKEPLAFLLENVPTLLQDRDMKPLLEGQLARVRGQYRLAARVLDAADYGVPQRRLRLFVLGLRRDLGARPGFPPPSHARARTLALLGRGMARWVTVGEAIGDIVDRPGALPGHDPPPMLPHDIAYGLEPLDPDGVSKTITTLVRCAKRASGGTFRTTVVVWLRKHPPAEMGRPSRTVTAHLAKNRGRPDLSVRPATTVNTRGFLAPPGNHATFCGRADPGVRKLSVRECLRLQSFPDWWRFPDGMSRTAKYVLVGEAVPPVLAYRLGVHLARLLGREPRVPPREGEWALPYFGRALWDLLDGG